MIAAAGPYIAPAIMSASGLLLTLSILALFDRASVPAGVLALIASGAGLYLGLMVMNA